MKQWINIAIQIKSEYKLLDLLRNDPNYSDEGGIGVTHFERNAIEFLKLLRLKGDNSFAVLKSLYGHKLIGFNPPFEEILDEKQTIFITAEGKKYLHDLKFSKYSSGLNIIMSMFIAVISVLLGIVGTLLFLS